MNSLVQTGYQTTEPNQIGTKTFRRGETQPRKKNGHFLSKNVHSELGAYTPSSECTFLAERTRIHPLFTVRSKSSSFVSAWFAAVFGNSLIGTSRLEDHW